jgi:signal transduction histidine kinase
MNGGTSTYNVVPTTGNTSTIAANNSVPMVSSWNVAGNGLTANANELGSVGNYYLTNVNGDITLTLSGSNTYTGVTTLNVLSGNLQSSNLQTAGLNDTQSQTPGRSQNPSLYLLQGNNRQLQQRQMQSSVALNRFSNVSSGTVPTRTSNASQPADSQTSVTFGTRPADPSQTVVTTGMMAPVWIGDHLLLARRVSSGSSEYLQGCWLDWSAIQGELKGLVEDLLPGLELEPVPASGGAERERMLATLPVRLLPGKLVLAEVAHSPLRLSLVPAWIGIVLAAIASAVLLAGILALSERRAAFVSAVTHEMRTPLTTFRMYAEMLAEGMVPDEAQRREYLETLRGEADRLAHLVENVLAYARLERTENRTRGEQLTLAALVDRATARLRTRSTQAGFELVVELAPEVGESKLWVDASAVEQVLFNLVDNACKYAQAATDRRLELSTGVEHGMARLTLRDHGAGIDRPQARALFRPFSKTDQQAARTAPGVGLGLALSRRLARAMGGDLQILPCDGPGAAFVLTLPLEPPRSAPTTA